MLLLSVLLGYLEAAKADASSSSRSWWASGSPAWRPSLTVDRCCDSVRVLPVGREVLEAVTALVAVVVLFYVSFWLIARARAQAVDGVRPRPAVERGLARSAASLMLVGFTAVYREGFETALFYQSLLVVRRGLGGYILLGFGAGPRRPRGRGVGDLQARPTLPIRTFMNIAVVAGHGSRRSPSSATRCTRCRRPTSSPTTALDGWPRLPIFLAAGHRVLADGADGRRPGVARRGVPARRALRVRPPPMRAAAGGSASTTPASGHAVVSTADGRP